LPTRTRFAPSASSKSASKLMILRVKGSPPAVVAVDWTLARFSETTRSRFDWASSPDAPIFKVACNGSAMALTLRAGEQHAMERLDHVGIEPIGAAHLRRLDQLLLQAHAVAGMGDVPRFGGANLRSGEIGRGCAQMRGVRGRHGELGAIERLFE